ncbi:MAG: T9SS type A sorting domain-containing protein [Bacteroidota bacterium]
MKQLLLFLLSLTSVAGAFGQNVWYPVDSMNGQPKSVTTSFVLYNEGFVVGGLTDVDFTRKMYSYNPLQDDWDDEVSWGGDMGGGQNRGSAVSFVAYNKAYVGLGQGNSAGFYNDFWEYDPSMEVWTQKADFMGSARRSAVGFSIDDIGYVGTGQDALGLTRDFYAYDALANSWSQLNDFGGTARKSATVLTMGGDAYLGTGDDGVLRNDFWQYQPATDTWIQRANLPGTGRSGAVGWGNFPTAFICSGEDPNGNFKNDLWEYNFFGNVWVQRANLPGPPRKHAMAFIINGVAFVGTGFNGVFLDDLYRYEQLLGTDEYQLVDVSVYPNPTSDLVTINSTEHWSTLEITDANGKQVFRTFTSGQSNGQITIPVSELPSGSYFLSGISATGLRFQTTFVKQ